ncbi:hypothetical protein [Streptomyces sp. CBMA29]|nr:hypothetical protein [Streptomyces sp. CBMA29]
MTDLESPPEGEPSENDRPKVNLWLAGISSAAALIGALAALIAAIRG